MKSLEEMVRMGEEKLRRKAPKMATSWNAAKSRAIAGYDTTPFGPTRKANFRSGIEAATYRSDPDKWARNWAAKMAE